MDKFAKIPEINKLLYDASDILKTNKIKIISVKDINYGCNIAFSFSGKTILLTLYYTAKNGFRFVFPKEVPEDIQKKIKDILFQSHEAEDKLVIPFEKYIGLDEAGKGDYFGALVLAGFIYDSSIKKDLIRLGVCDSKNLSDERIHSISAELMEQFPERTKIMEIIPERYNEQYRDLKKKGMNLNHLLALSYKEIIDNSLKNDKTLGIVLDKFASEDFIKKITLKGQPSAKMILVENAERDLAVAAASILARSVFIKNIQMLSDKYKFTLPLGGGNNVVSAAKEFYRKFGEKNLYLTSKDHFKITKMVLESLF